MDQINVRVETFGEAIVTLVDRLLPRGFDVGDDAPQTYTQLKALLDTGKRLIVWSGGCEQIIYTHPNINVAFRAWHDHCHWMGGYDFSLEGEIAACDLQCRQLLEHHGDNPVTQSWCALIRAEVIGYDDFVTHGGEQGAKDAGRWRLEGKEYVVQDGDVMHFRFNV